MNVWDSPRGKGPDLVMDNGHGRYELYSIAAKSSRIGKPRTGRQGNGKRIGLHRWRSVIKRLGPEVRARHGVFTAHFSG